MAAFFRSYPARRPKKPKAERLLYHFDKLTIGRETQTLMSAKAMPYSSFITRL